MSDKKKHDKDSPSSFPALELCIHYESSGEDNAASTAGTLQHDYLDALVKNDPKLIEETSSKIDATQVENVHWVFERVRYHINLAQKATGQQVQVVSEFKLKTSATNGTVKSGTGDVIIVTVNGSYGIIIDAKFGMIRKYDGQMNVYGLGTMQAVQSLQEVTCIACYGKERTEESFTITREEAQNYFDGMIDKIAKRKDTAPVPCSYCGWCAKKLKCKGLMGAVTVMKSFAKEDAKKLMNRVTDASLPAKMNDDKLGNLIKFTEIIVTFYDELKKEALKRINDDKVVPGFVKARHNTGKSFTSITDAASMLQATGVNPNAILNECSLSMAGARRLLYGPKDSDKAANKRDFEERFGGILKDGYETFYIKGATPKQLKEQIEKLNSTSLEESNDKQINNEEK